MSASNPAALTDEMIGEAAEFLAEGHSWETAAARVGTDSAMLRRYARDNYAKYQRIYRVAWKRVWRQAAAEAFAVLRRLAIGRDDTLALKAAKTIVSYATLERRREPAEMSAMHREVRAKVRGDEDEKSRADKKTVAPVTPVAKAAPAAPAALAAPAAPIANPPSAVTRLEAIRSRKLLASVMPGVKTHTNGSAGRTMTSFLDPIPAG